MTDGEVVQPRLFDADNHYYEARDAFTRHLPPRLAERTVTEVRIDGRVRHLIGGRLNHAVTNPTFDPVSKPGALYGYFRGNADGKDLRALLSDAEPIRPEYREPGARVKVMDAQQVEAAWLFPTLGVMYEEALKHDPEAVGITFRSFNRWLDEDWGLHHADRILAAPYISLADVHWAVAELECPPRRARRARSRARARVGAGAWGAPGLPAPRSADLCRRDLLAGRPALRPVLGTGQRGRHHRCRARRGDGVLVARLCRRRDRGVRAAALSLEAVARRGQH